MTPAARLSAAIGLLDEILTAEPAERALTRWARQNRYAGSKDRAAVRDIVFDCLRQKRSLGHLAGDMSGRALVSAHQFKAGEDVEVQRVRPLDARQGAPGARGAEPGVRAEEGRRSEDAYAD